MPSAQSSPSSPFLRRSPAVQALQRRSPHRDYLTGSKFWNEINVTVSHAHPEKPGLSQSPQRLQLSSIPSKPSQWTGNGHGSKHRNDESPFNLWDPETRSYRTPTQKEVEWIFQRYQATELTLAPGLLCVITNSPPTPAANTVGGQPTLFLGPEVKVSYSIAGAKYQNPRLPDPYIGQKWGMMDAPTMAQMIAVKEALDRMMNVRRIMFFQAFNVVELVVGDGRNYTHASLPGRVAGISTSYYHQETPFMDDMRDLTRARFINPQPRGGPIAQDTTNYLNPVVPRQARRNPSPYARYACKHHNHDQCSNRPKRIQELDFGSAHPKARTAARRPLRDGVRSQLPGQHARKWPHCIQVRRKGMASRR